MPTQSPHSFVRRIEVAPGQSVTIPTSHVARTTNGGYVVTSGPGRQAPSYLGAAR